MINDDIYLCPICGKRLENKKISYKCINNHTFDISTEGYLHLLPSDRMNSKLPGDNKDMVLSRRDFLNGSYYQILSDKINLIIASLINDIDQPLLLDSGCGEGYYTDRLYQYLIDRQSVHIVGLDISKVAIKYAAKRNGKVDYIVASVNVIPIKSNTLNLIVNMFAPVDINEYNRLLEVNGYLVMVIPGRNHLMRLKEIIYSNPYHNEISIPELVNFTLIDNININSVINIDNNKDINNLFKMTPYYYNTSYYDKSKLENINGLITEIEFEILVYRKKGK